MIIVSSLRLSILRWNKLILIALVRNILAISVLNVNKLMLKLFNWCRSRVIKPFLLFVGTINHLYTRILNQKWGRGSIVQSCCRRLQRDRNMSRCNFLSIHVNLAWLGLILVDRAVWPYIQPIPQTIWHCDLMLCFFLKPILVKLLLLWRSDYSTLHIRFDYWIRVRLVSLCRQSPKTTHCIALPKASGARNWLLKSHLACWWYLHGSWLIILNGT